MYRWPYIGTGISSTYSLHFIFIMSIEDKAYNKYDVSSSKDCIPVKYEYYCVAWHLRLGWPDRENRINICLFEMRQTNLLLLGFQLLFDIITWFKLVSNHKTNMLWLKSKQKSHEWSLFGNKAMKLNLY